MPDPPHPQHDNPNLSHQAGPKTGRTCLGIAAGHLVLAAIATITSVLFVIWASDTDAPASHNAATRTSAEPKAMYSPQTAIGPTASPSEREAVEPVLIEHDLGTGSNEFSAIALNEELNRLLILDDEGLLFEFDIEPSGSPIVPARRVMHITLGAGDTEGIAWIRDQTYVIAHENNGHLTVVNITEQTTMIDATHVVRTIDTAIREIDGKGIEGVAYFADPSLDIEFVAVREQPPMLLLINHAGEVKETIDIELGLTDTSDVSASIDGSITLVSDENQTLLDVQLNDGQLITTSTLRLKFEASQFEQPEGVVRSRDGRSLYVVGEKPGDGRVVFGLWHIDP